MYALGFPKANTLKGYSRLFTHDNGDVFCCATENGAIIINASVHRYRRRRGSCISQNLPMLKKYPFVPSLCPTSTRKCFFSVNNRIRYDNFTKQAVSTAFIDINQTSMDTCYFLFSYIIHLYLPVVYLNKLKFVCMVLLIINILKYRSSIGSKKKFSNTY
jgi:hypothetical protein